jgi:hypothetical protein
MKKHMKTLMALSIIGVIPMNVIASDKFDPAVAARQNSLESLVKPGELELGIKNYSDYVAILEQKLSLTFIRNELERILSNNTKTDKLYYKGIKELELMEISSAFYNRPDIANIKLLISDLKKATAKDIDRLRELNSKGELKYKDLVPFAQTWASIGKNINSNIESIMANMPQKLSELIESALKSARQAECPKTLTKDQWKTLKDKSSINLNGGLYNLDSSTKDNFPSSLQIITWGSLEKAPISTDYDWSKRTLYCSAEYETAIKGKSYVIKFYQTK